MQNVSTLMDGELNVDEADREIGRLKLDPASRESWDAYHLIGDAMRGSATGTSGFNARFSERLALEPTVLAPRRRFSHKVQTYALAAAASVAAAAAVGWVSLAMMGPPMEGAIVAKGDGRQGANVVASPLVSENQPKPPVPQREPASQIAKNAEQFQEYLLAHQGISPITAIQGVTPYVRTVSNTDE